MFPKNALVKARKAIEKGYIGKVTITERKKVTKANHSTGFTEVDILLDQPCRLSFSRSPAAEAGRTAELKQTVKLFLPPELIVLEGSKLTVTQNGITTVYKRSGPAAVYQTHQEITLELFERWA